MVRKTRTTPVRIATTRSPDVAEVRKTITTQPCPSCRRRTFGLAQPVWVRASGETYYVSYTKMHCRKCGFEEVVISKRRLKELITTPLKRRTGARMERT